MTLDWHFPPRGAPRKAPWFETSTPNQRLNLKTAVARAESLQDLGAIRVCRSGTDHPSDMHRRSAHFLRSSFCKPSTRSTAVLRLKRRFSGERPDRPANISPTDKC